jgi:hypothetical protein
MRNAECRKMFARGRGGQLQAYKRAKAVFTEGLLSSQAYRQAYKRATKRTSVPGEE